MQANAGRQSVWVSCEDTTYSYFLLSRLSLLLKDIVLYIYETTAHHIQLDIMHML